MKQDALVLQISNRVILLGVALILSIMCTGIIFARQDFSSQPHWKGQGVFRNKGCVQCHDVYGDNKKDGPDLGKEKFYGTYLQLASKMWNHFPRMYQNMQNSGYQFEEFLPSEMAQLIAYLSFIRYMGETGSEFAGRKLLTSKGCVECHRFGDNGSNLGPDITINEEYMTPVALVEAMWNHGPNMRGLFEQHNIERPELTGEEIVDLATAIRSHMRPSRVPAQSFQYGDPKLGRKICQARGCLNCHSVNGVGGTLGPEFEEIDVDRSVTEIAGMMWNHGPDMWEVMERENIPFPTFAQGEMADLIAYLYSLMLEDPPGDVAAGRKIVNERGCLNCHSLQGDRPSISKDLSKIGPLESPVAMISAMWNHAPTMQEKFEGRQLNWPELEGGDMADLFAFLREISQSADSGQP